MTPSKDSPGAGSKITIKGFSLSSQSNSGRANSKPKLTAKSTLGKRPRSTFAHRDDTDDEQQRESRHESVTGFGENGAVRESAEEKLGPLVIERLGNTRATPGMARVEGARKRGAGMKNLLPVEVVAAREKAQNGWSVDQDEVHKEVLNAPEDEKRWGLDISVRKRAKIENDGAALGNQPPDTTTDSIGSGMKENSQPIPKTEDELALAALLGQELKKKGPDLVIESISTTERTEVISEEDAYRRAIATAPDVSTLEDYERVPVEEFGAALLRGMGWKGEKNGGAKPGQSTNRWEVKRRQNLLGLGAKELKGAEELGAWVQKSDIKKLKTSDGRGGGRDDGRVRVSDYRREEEKRRERREARGGGSYRDERMEKNRDRDYERGRGDRDRDRDRDRRR